MFIISRAVGGITLNSGREYLADDDGKIMKFPDMIEAKKFLARNGVTEVDVIAMGMNFEEVLDNEQRRENDE